MTDASGNQVSGSLAVAAGVLGVSQPAGARDASSAANSYLDVRTVSNGRLLSTVSATNFAAGVCTGVGGAVGVANDTILIGLLIFAAATAVTVTLTGFLNDTGAAANYVISGDTSTLDAAPTFIPLGLVNDGGPLSITASVAGSVIALTRPA